MTMDRIGVGDTVITPCGAQEVYFQTHHDNETESMYVNIVTDSGHKLQLSSDHFVTTDGQHRLATSVREGQAIEVYGLDGPQLATVTNVYNSREVGAFNPMVPCGKLWVNNVTASDISTTGWSFEDLVAEDGLPTLYHRLFYPLRMLYNLHPNGVKAFCDGFRGGAAISEFSVATIVNRAVAAWLQK